MMTDEMNAKVPPPVVLGWLGVLPFVGLAALGWWPQSPIWTTGAFVGYSAIILSFLGGIRWGRAMQVDAAPTEFVRSVMPSLLAWPALMLPLDTAIGALALGHGLALMIDTRGDGLGAPAWFRQLRIRLSLCVIACHAVVYLNHSQ